MNFDSYITAVAAIETEPDGFDQTLALAKYTRSRGRVYFIGNGGSSAIASHMAIDWLNKAHFAATSFNDPAALTCLANDYGYEQIYERQIMRHIKPDDLLFAISSSGNSPNIIKAVEHANLVGKTITLSGFLPDNPLRKLGAVNFYVPSSNYGVVETVHLAILHAILEQLMP